MNTTTATQPKTFLRKRAIGSDFLVCNEDNPTVQVEIVSAKFETDSTGKRDQTFLTVKNLQTDQTEKLWVGGQLKHTLGKVKALKGLKIEINWKGRAEVVDEETGEVVRPNQYSVFELA